MKKINTFFVWGILALGATTASAQSWHYVLGAGQVGYNYGQINGPVYLGPGSQFTNYGQINSYVVCERCQLIDFGQINGQIIYR